MDDPKSFSSVIFHTANGTKIEVTERQMATVRSILWQNTSDSNMKQQVNECTQIKTNKYFDDEDDDKENIIQSSSIVNNNINDDILLDDIDDDFYDDIFISSSTSIIMDSLKNEPMKKRYLESSSKQSPLSKRKRSS